jgi:hypothetical membrane protein
MIDKTSIILFSGILAVAVYLFSVILGGSFYPDYSHASQAISELVGSHSPTRNVLNPLFLAYNTLLLIFALAIYRRYDNRKSKIGAICLIIIALASILMWWFPMDSKGHQATFQGTIHIVLASVEALMTVIATVMLGIGLKKSHPTFSLISIVTGFLLLVFGPAAGISAAQNSPNMGIYERITIGIFMLWLIIIAATAISNKQPNRIQ